MYHSISDSNLDAYIPAAKCVSRAVIGYSKDQDAIRMHSNEDLILSNLMQGNVHLCASRSTRVVYGYGPEEI